MCSCEGAGEVTRDERVSRFVGVRGGYKAMVGCMLEMHTGEEEVAVCCEQDIYTCMCVTLTIA